MKVLRVGVFAVALALAACGQQQQQPSGQSGDYASPADEEFADEAPADLPQVAADLLAAPNEGFVAIEPSEVGVFAAPTVMEALAPLLGPEMTEGADVSLSVRESGDETVVDMVRAGLADDSVSAGHVRIEFRREPEGWFPTNAYRRSQCARGGEAGQWTTGLCP